MATHVTCPVHSQVDPKAELVSLTDFKAILVVQKLHCSLLGTNDNTVSSLSALNQHDPKAIVSAVVRIQTT